MDKSFQCFAQIESVILSIFITSAQGVLKYEKSNYLTIAIIF